MNKLLLYSILTMILIYTKLKIKRCEYIMLLSAIYYKLVFKS